MEEIGNLTAKRFEEICWRQLLVRVLVETLPKDAPEKFKSARVETTIHLFSLRQDTDTNQFFTGLTYHDEDPIGLSKSYEDLRGLADIPTGTREERLDTIEEILDRWSETRMLLWLLDKPIVACRKSGKEIQEIKAWDIRLLQHYARLETRLAYEIKGNVHSPWVLSGIFHRIVGLIREQNRVWEPLLT